VLETAAGTGIVTASLRSALGAEAKIAATDINDEMLKIAREKLAGDTNMEFSVADASELPFADNSFDSAVCQFGMMFFPDKVQALREVHRVLKPGGLYVTNVWDAIAQNDFVRVADATLAATYPNDAPKFYEIPFGWYDSDEIREAFNAAGFSDCTIEVSTKDCISESAASVTFALIDSSPMSTELDELEGVDTATVKSRITENITKEFGDPPKGAKMQALVISARVEK
jgi:ubiquinone/menaquinone biosynthesis C-methylase UbiE